MVIRLMDILQKDRQGKKKESNTYLGQLKNRTEKPPQKSNNFEIIKLNSCLIA